MSSREDARDGPQTGEHGDSTRQPMSGGKPGGVHPRNTLNDLTGKQWLRFTRTWDVYDSPRYHRNRHTELHPARYPEELVADFVRFFTKRGQWVLDPFAGTGATLVACQETGRNGVGIELNPRYAEICRDRTPATSAEGMQFRTIQADAREIDSPELWTALSDCAMPHDATGLPLFDFIMTSPPYWRMLRTSRGGVVSAHKERVGQGLDGHYSEDRQDLGNIDDYEHFLEQLEAVFASLARRLQPQRYLVIVVQNLRRPDGEIAPLAWDLCRRVNRHLRFQGERIWCQDKKKLGIWGYPTTYVPNYHHHYCLVFRNESRG